MADDDDDDSLTESDKVPRKAQIRAAFMRHELSSTVSLVFGMMAGAAIGIFFAVYFKNRGFAEVSSLSINVFAVAAGALVAVTSFFVFFLKYLQRDSGGDRYSSRKVMTEARKRESWLAAGQRELRRELEELKTQSLFLGHEDFNAARKELKSTLESATAQGVLADLKEKIGEQVKKENIAAELESSLTMTLKRLENEVWALSRRGNLNLVLGIFTTISGLGIFTYSVFGGQNLTQDATVIASYYLPRLSLVILIEIFAYFFLNLYKSSLNDIKYFQNETTNIEAKHTALQFALILKEKKTLNTVLSSLATTERNFTLKKGESTVRLEQDKIDSDSIRNFSESLSEFLGWMKQRGKNP